MIYLLIVKPYHFTAFRPYIVEVTTNNLGPELNNDATGVGEWVFKNYGRTTSLRGRRYLNDRGINLDLIINDNIHTGGWRAHGLGLVCETEDLDHSLRQSI